MSETTDRIALIRERLAVLEPLSLEILDDSHLHAGHEGSKNGAGHYRVIIVAPCFAGLSAVARHRLVYHHLQDLIPYPIHALALDAQAPK
jgi:BolA protein